MTGIERLRELTRIWTCDCKVLVEQKKLADIADQIERELTCDADTIENIRLIVGGVIDDMERHVSGVDGMEDSPVARWARELREALGGDGRDPAKDVSMSAYDLLPEAEREAIAWVRDHGGLDAVKTHWKRISYYADPVPRSYAEKRIAKLKRQIDENHAALRRKNKRIAELEAKVRVRERANDELNEELIAMRPRLMPEGVEWPRYESGEPVGFGDEVSRLGEVFSISLYCDGSFALNFRAYSKGEPIKRPAPKVPDADGADTSVGDAVWAVGDAGPSMKVLEIKPDDDPDAPEHLVWCGETCGGQLGDVKKWRIATDLTHRAPVPDADGADTSVGDTVYDVDTGEKMWVCALPEQRAYQCVKLRLINGMFKTLDPCRFTHERPVVDAWERLEEDAEKDPCDYFGFDGEEICGKCPASGKNCEQTMARDLVRRAKELAGVSE